MLEVLKDQKINNYLSWAQKGKSSAFSSLLAGELQNLQRALYFYISLICVITRFAHVTFINIFALC